MPDDLTTDAAQARERANDAIPILESAGRHIARATELAGASIAAVTPGECIDLMGSALDAVDLAIDLLEGV